MRSLIFFLIIIVALGASFVLVGFCAPIEQSSELSKELNCSKGDVWDRITNVELFKDYKFDVAEIEVVGHNGKKWIEYSKQGAITEYEIIESVEGEKLVVKIFDKALNIEKKRVYTIFGSGNSSILSIKEFTRVEKLLLRSTLAIAGNKQEIKKELNNIAEHVNL